MFVIHEYCVPSKQTCSYVMRLSLKCYVYYCIDNIEIFVVNSFECGWRDVI